MTPAFAAGSCRETTFISNLLWLILRNWYLWCSLITFWNSISQMFNEMSFESASLQCLALALCVAAWFDNRKHVKPPTGTWDLMRLFEQKVCQKTHQCAIVDFLSAEKDPQHQRFFDWNPPLRCICTAKTRLLQQICFSNPSAFVKPLQHQLTTPNPWPTFTNLTPNIALLTRHMSSPCRSWPWREATRHRCSQRCRWISSLSCPWDVPGGRSSRGAMGWWVASGKVKI